MRYVQAGYEIYVPTVSSRIIGNLTTYVASSHHPGKLCGGFLRKVW